MSTYTETGERTPPPPFCEVCGHRLNAYGQCYCDQEPETEDDLEIFAEEPDNHEESSVEA